MHLRPLGHLSVKNTVYGGEGGIRTHGDRTATPVFETGPFDHSGTSPQFIWPTAIERKNLGAGQRILVRALHREPDNSG